MWKTGVPQAARPAIPGGLAVALAVLLAGCGPRLTTPPPGQMPAGFPEAYYREAATLGKRVLRVDARRSLVAITVRRGGTLARLGHDHVVASHDLRGWVAEDEGRTDIYLPLEALTVDEAELRTAAGLNTPVSQDVAAGTRRNMLTTVLDAAHFPFALIHATGHGTDPSILDVEITLHGTARLFKVPVSIGHQGGELVVSGRMSLRQSDFGITPMSILGGALQVQDGLEMRFRVVATGA